MLLLLHAIIPCLHTCMNCNSSFCGSMNSELQTICYFVSLSLLCMHNFHAVFNHFVKPLTPPPPHRTLIEKLKALNISPIIIRWVFSYLTGRCQRVVVAGATSQPSSIVSDVPQGSLLGPLLFLIYIDDVSRINLSTGAELILYADDILLYKRIKTLEDYIELQQDIDLLFHWAQNNSMAFNMSKCKYMIVSRKHNPSLPPTLCLGNTPLERVHMWCNTYLQPLLVRTYKLCVYESKKNKLAYCTDVSMLTQIN